MAAAFVLQFLWMQRVRREGPESIAPNSLAEKISRWMMQKRGLVVEESGLTGPSGVGQVSCSTCSGTGFVYSEGGEPIPCSICDGVGGRMLRVLHDDDQQCPACAGMGRVRLEESGEIMLCPRCGGRGLVRRAAADGSGTD